MKHAINRAAALTLVIGLLLSLAGCGGGEAEPDTPAPAPISFQSSAFYQTESAVLLEDAGTVAGGCTDGESFYCLLEDGDQTVSLYRASLTDGTAVKLEGYASAASADRQISPAGLTLDGQGGLWALETWRIFTYDLPEDFDEENDEKYNYITNKEYHCLLRQLDRETGAVKSELDLSQPLGEIWPDWRGDWAVDAKGRAYFAAGNAVTVVDQQGQVLAVLEIEGQLSYLNGSALTLLSDGSIAILAQNDQGQREARCIGSDGKSWSDAAYTVPSDTDRLWPGRGEFLFFCSSDRVLYGRTSEEAGIYKLLEWSSADVNSQSAQSFALLEESRASILSHSDGQLRTTVLTPSDTAEDGRTVLVVGTIDPDSTLRDQIVRFNKENQEYVITIQDYTEDFQGSGMTMREIQERAMTRLDIDLVSGKAPDLLDGSFLPLQRYAAKGGLEDLWPWIDSDPELGRDAVMSHVLDCAAQDGKLYLASDRFYLQALAAPASRIGDGSDLSLTDLIELYDAMPEGSAVLDAGTSPSLTLLLLSRNGQSFVDWSSGTCSFDSPEFIQLLELCACQPDEEPQSYGKYGLPYDDGGQALREGRQLLKQTAIADLGQFMANEALCGGAEALWDYPGMLREKGIPRTYNLKYDFADEVVQGALKEGRYASYVSLPTGSGLSAGSFILGDVAAMPAACPHKEGAWSFIRQLLLPGGAKHPSGTDWDGSTLMLDWNFPMNRADFEAKMADAMEQKWFSITGKDGTETLLLGNDGQPVEECTSIKTLGNPVSICFYQLAIQQSDCDRFMDLYHAVTQIDDWSYDFTLVRILQEQSALFFSGDATAKDAARAIQSRAALYLGEQS